VFHKYELGNDSNYAKGGMRYAFPPYGLTVLCHGGSFREFIEGEVGSICQAKLGLKWRSQAKLGNEVIM